jgi:hypothetical protein
MSVGGLTTGRSAAGGIRCSHAPLSAARRVRPPFLLAGPLSAMLDNLMKGLNITREPS